MLKNKISIDFIHPKVACGTLASLDNNRVHVLEYYAHSLVAMFPVANSIMASLNSGNNGFDTIALKPVLADDAIMANSGCCHGPVLRIAITVTPRHTIGKKKAKAIALQA
jgi:hypothetical protein